MDDQIFLKQRSVQMHIAAYQKMDKNLCEWDSMNTRNTLKVNKRQGDLLYTWLLARQHLRKSANNARCLLKCVNNVQQLNAYESTCILSTVTMRHYEAINFDKGNIESILFNWFWFDCLLYCCIGILLLFSLILEVEEIACIFLLTCLCIVRSSSSSIKC